MYQFMAILISVILLGYLLERFLISIFGFRFFRFLTAPGIIIHELSHALTAMIFGAKIKSFEVFKTEGGEVTYTRPHFHIIAQPLISTAPILVCSLVLYFVGIFLGFNFQKLGLEFSFSDLVLIFKTFDFTLLKTFLFFYLVLSLTSAMAPSKRDLANAFWGLALFLIIFLVIYYLFPTTNIVFLKMSYFYLVGLYMIILAILVALVFWLVKLLLTKALKV